MLLRPFLRFVLELDCRGFAVAPASATSWLFTLLDVLVLRLFVVLFQIWPCHPLAEVSLFLVDSPVDFLDLTSEPGFIGFMVAVRSATSSLPTASDMAACIIPLIVLDGFSKVCDPCLSAPLLLSLPTSPEPSSFCSLFSISALETSTSRSILFNSRSRSSARTRKAEISASR